LLELLVNHRRQETLVALSLVPRLRFRCHNVYLTKASAKFAWTTRIHIHESIIATLSHYLKRLM
jgi:hypothetical protein